MVLVIVVKGGVGVLVIVIVRSVRPVNVGVDVLIPNAISSAQASNIGLRHNHCCKLTPPTRHAAGTHVSGSICSKDLGG